MVYLHGAKESEIADSLGIKPATLRDWKKRPEWAGTVLRLRDEQRAIASDRLSFLTDKAVTALQQSLDSDNQTVRLKAAMWVLERVDLAESYNGPTEFEFLIKSSESHGT